MRVACIYFNQEVNLDEFAEACLRFSPQIAILSPNIVFIEIGKCASLYSEMSFIARVQALIKRFKVSADITLGPDIPTTLALARFKLKSLDHLPIESLCDFGDPLGTDPDGRKEVTKMIETLKRLGITTISQFKTIPISQIPSRFGGLGLFCRQRIEETIHLPWPYWRPPERLVERAELSSSDYCSHLEPLLFKSKELLDRVFSRLRGRFLRAEKITFVIELERNSTVQNPTRLWEFELIVPQGATLGFLPILRERLSWDLSQNPLESDVASMNFEVTSTSLGKSAQRNFFHSREEFNEAMGSFFGQLEEFLGKGQVFWSKITEERFPEKSWDRSRLAVKEQVDLTGRYPLRPTRLFRSPLPMTVIQDRVKLKNRVFKARSWTELERLSPDWIDEVSSRNYYRVELEGGVTLWVFSDPSHHYFAHGYFE